MREISKEGAWVPGSIPGGGYNSSSGNQDGNGSATELSSVEIAKRLPETAPVGTPESHRVFALPPVGEGDKGAREIVPNAHAVGTSQGEETARGEGGCSPSVVRACRIAGCDTLLGEEVAGDLCAVHRRFEPVTARCFGYERGCACRDCEARAYKCARKGCGEPRVADSIFCRGHHACALSTSCDNLPAIADEGAAVVDESRWCKYIEGYCSRLPHPERVPVIRPGMRAEEVIEQAMEAAWVALAESDALDPVTVAACKRLRDLERKAVRS